MHLPIIHRAFKAPLNFTILLYKSSNLNVLLLLFFNNFVCVCVSQKTEALDPLAAGDIGSCKLPNIGAGN